jgi:hypothetical protein
MMNLRKSGVALVLGLVLSLSTLSSGAFAQSANHSVASNATQVAVASHASFLGTGFGGFGFGFPFGFGFGGFGFGFPFFDCGCFF